MLTQPYILVDDAPGRNQRLTFEIYGLAVAVPVIVCLAWHIVKNIRLRILEHGKYSFLWFYLCVEASFVFRLLYCYSFSFSFGPRFINFPPLLYGIWCFFPPVLTTTASLFFLISMLNSLDEVYQTNKQQKFGKLKVLVMLCIVVFWVICVALYAALSYTDIKYGKASNSWVSTFFYTSASSNIGVCIILIVITIYYIKELRNFTYTYNSKKRIIFTMLAGTILQLVLRILQSILNATGLLLELEKHCGETGEVSFQLYTCGYFFFSDLVPTIGYVLFLRKEIEAQMSVEASASEITVNSTTTSTNNSNVTALLERLYKKKEAQKGTNPILIQSNYDGNSLGLQDA